MAKLKGRKYENVWSIWDKLCKSKWKYKRQAQWNIWKVIIGHSLCILLSLGLRINKFEMHHRLDDGDTDNERGKWDIGSKISRTYFSFFMYYHVHNYVVIFL